MMTSTRFATSLVLCAGLFAWIEGCGDEPMPVDAGRVDGGDDERADAGDTSRDGAIDGSSPDGGAPPVVCPSTPTGTTYVVATTGDDGAVGSAEQPFGTITHALSIAEPGDRVLVRAGVHDGPVVFPRSGTEGNPIILEGEPGAIIDAGDRMTGWEPAPEMGPDVWKNDDFEYEPYDATWNDRTILHIRYDIADDEVAAILRDGPMGWDTYQGDPYRSWDGVEAMFVTRDGVTYLGFGESVDPNEEDLTFAREKRGVIDVVGRSHVTICGLQLEHAQRGVMIDEGSQHVVVHGNRIVGGARGVAIEGGSSDVVVSENEITLQYIHSLDPNDARHWFIWAAFKVWSDYDRIAVNLEDAGDDILVTRNHVFQHWGGVQDVARSDPEAHARNLEVSFNHIEHIADDGLEPNGGEVNARWHDNLVHDCNINFRVKPPAIGPMYIYRNRLSSPLTESTRGENLAFYFHVGVPGEIYVYHNSIAGYRATSMGNDRDVGAPNTWYLNNVFSTTRFGDGAGDANFARFDHNWIGGDVTPQSYLLEHNVLVPGETLWAEGDHAMSIPESSGAWQSGIDLSASWTLDGETHPALPGMSPGYFTGPAPNLGYAP